MPTESRELILVDEHDTVVGFDEKLSVHRNGGRLHRAFSVLIFNTRGEMLLQLRAAAKYHFGGLWTNACCGHPTRNETTLAAASQRLIHEFGISAELRALFAFTYEAFDASSGLTEREYDHVLQGVFDGTPAPNPAEIDDFRWVSMPALYEDVERSANRYTPWFRILLEKYQRRN